MFNHQTRRTMAEYGSTRQVRRLVLITDFEHAKVILDAAQAYDSAEDDLIELLVAHGGASPIAPHEEAGAVETINKYINARRVFTVALESEGRIPLDVI